MLTYWFLFALLAWMALTHLRPLTTTSMQRTKWGLAWIGIFALLVTLIGFRHEVGGDWFTYLNHVETLQNEPLSEFWLHGDPAYSLLNWVAANVFGGIYLTNTVSAILFGWGLVYFCKSQPRPWLVLVVAMPYLITVVAMGYTRQGVAIGLAMLAMVALFEGSIWRFIGWIALAGLFHKSAIVLIPMAVFGDTRRLWITTLGVAVTGILLFLLLLQEAMEGLVSNYIEAEYQSAGAGIRIAMNAVPAALFLWFRKRFALPDKVRRFWTWMAISALGFVVLLLISPSSTAVDRVALYWIPLQLFVWGRLPDALGLPGRKNPIWVCLVVLYSALVLFVWLFFAEHSSAWLPYRFYPFEML